jgi:hypothetical protein
MSESTSWYDKFSSIQLIFLGFLLLGVTPLIRNPEYFEILTNTDLWNTPKINEAIKAVLTDGCIGALVGVWFVFRKKN